MRKTFKAEFTVEIEDGQAKAIPEYQVMDTLKSIARRSENHPSDPGWISEMHLTNLEEVDKKDE